MFVEQVNGSAQSFKVKSRRPNFAFQFPDVVGPGKKRNQRIRMRAEVQKSKQRPTPNVRRNKDGLMMV